MSGRRRLLGLPDHHELRVRGAIDTEVDLDTSTPVEVEVEAVLSALGAEIENDVLTVKAHTIIPFEACRLHVAECGTLQRADQALETVKLMRGGRAKVPVAAGALPEPV